MLLMKEQMNCVNSFIRYIHPPIRYYKKNHNMDYGAPVVDPNMGQPIEPSTMAPVDSWNGQQPIPGQEYGIIPQQQQGMVIPPPQPASGQKVGTVKKWDDGRGYGFIANEDGTDMFYLAKQNGGQTLIQGGQVYYEVELQDNGKPWATNVSGMGVGPPQMRGERQPWDDGMGYGKGKGKKGKDGKKGGKKGGKDGKGKGFGKDGFKGYGKEGKKGKKSGSKGDFGLPPAISNAPLPMPGSGGTGIVKKWYTDKGYGFISTAEGAKDLFVHHKGINGICMEGSEVNYTVESQANGQPWYVYCYHLFML